MSEDINFIYKNKRNTLDWRESRQRPENSWRSARKKAIISPAMFYSKALYKNTKELAYSSEYKVANIQAFPVYIHSPNIIV